jgi:hypothetical protein
MNNVTGDDKKEPQPHILRCCFAFAFDCCFPRHKEVQCRFAGVASALVYRNYILILSKLAFSE